MSDIIKRLRKAREATLEIDGHTYTYRRPTDAEASKFSSNDIGVVDIVRVFVIGWDLTEADLLPSGGSDPVPFSPELWREYVDDKPNLWPPLFEAIVASYSKHQEAIERAGKA